MILVLGILFLALYITVTWIFWRNVPLTGFSKVLYCLTVSPLCIALLVVNVIWVERYAPFLVDLFSAAEGGDGEALIAVLISFPLPVAFSFVWYKLVKWLAERDRIARQYYD